MSKELEKALMTFSYIMTRCVEEDSYIIKFPLGVELGTTFGEQMQSAYNTIEKELQRLEAIDNSNPSEALKSLEKVNNYLNNVYDYKEIKEEVQKDINSIKQTLLKSQEQEKVLEIIKEKDVDMYSLRRCETVEEYNINFAIDEYQELTKEEFDLLKRLVCKNE